MKTPEGALALAATGTLPARVPPRAEPRPTTLTRRYEVSWLTRTGEVQTMTRIAPALPGFEAAFSAFARGTLIATDAGPVAVEDLAPGMRALTAEGGAEPIVWIGSMTLFPPRATPQADPPRLTRIAAEAFGPDRPMPDLVLGPGARLLLRDPRCRRLAGTEAAYVPARTFQDGVSVIEVTPVTPVPVFHLALARHGSLRAAGMEIESFHPGPGFARTLAPHTAGLYLSLFPHVDGLDGFGPLAHPRLGPAEIEALG